MEAGDEGTEANGTNKLTTKVRRPSTGDDLPITASTGIGVERLLLLSTKGLI